MEKYRLDSYPNDRHAIYDQEIGRTMAYSVTESDGEKIVKLLNKIDLSPILKEMCHYQVTLNRCLENCMFKKYCPSPGK